MERTIMNEVVLGNAVKVGEKEFINIPIEMLVIDKNYQRLVGNKVNSIIANYDIRKLRIPIVSYRDGVFYLIDGQNRSEALKKMGKTTITCELLRDLTEAQEAEIFITQNDNVNKITPKDKIKGKALLGDPFAVDVLELCEKYNLDYGMNSYNRKYQFTALSRLEVIYNNYGKKGIEYFINIMFSADWEHHDKCFGAAMCRMIKHILDTYGYDKTEKLIALLKGFKSYNALSVKAKEAYVSSEELSICMFVKELLK